ncbi:MAG: DUF981 family protein [Phycisphaerae bacterium]
MFIDYITLMLLNLVAGLLTLGLFLTVGLGKPSQRNWAGAFAVVGLVGFAAGLHMTLTWPLPVESPVAWANIVFGEMMTVFGALFLGAALSLACRWSLKPLGIYAVVAGLIAIVLGINILVLGYTMATHLSMVGFVLAGLGGVLTCFALLVEKSKALRLLAGVVLIVAALVWVPTLLGAYLGHMEKYGPPKEPTTQESSMLAPPGVWQSIA